MGEPNIFYHETERLILRDWADRDWKPFWQETNTPEVMRWLGGVCDGQEREEAQARLLSYRREHGHTFWVVERREDSAIIGFCGLKRSNQQGSPIGMMEIGWRLGQDFWGQGYAKEAATTSLDLAFDHFGTDEVVALTVKRNAASWGLMQRLGMQRRPDLDFANGDFDPENPTIIVYSITENEWHG